MRCWREYQQGIQETMRLDFAMLNYLQDQMAFVAGVPNIGPRIQVPTPAYIANAPVTMNTTNKIHVEAGSQVGQINAGAIVYLNRAVTSFSSAGMREVAAALQGFSQQVVESGELSAEAQKRF